MRRRRSASRRRTASLPRLAAGSWGSIRPQCARGYFEREQDIVSAVDARQAADQLVAAQAGRTGSHPDLWHVREDWVHALDSLHHRHHITSPRPFLSPCCLFVIRARLVRVSQISMVHLAEGEHAQTNALRLSCAGSGNGGDLGSAGTLRMRALWMAKAKVTMVHNGERFTGYPLSACFSHGP